TSFSPTAILATLAAALLAFGSYVSCAGTQDVQAMLATLRASAGPLALLLLAFAYALALAVPFVPGMELGLLIMVTFGTKGILVVYAATVLGLCLAYAAGCVLPQRMVPKRLRAGGLALCHPDLESTLAAPILPSRFTGPPKRKLAGGILAYRYLALAVCLNLPGNALVGGGGGIALLCGISRQFGCVRYLLTICLAASPIPILMLTGLTRL
ncbi:MAG: hypothetical protein ABI478_07240, partial [Propionivibrio sp.]